MAAAKSHGLDCICHQAHRLHPFSCDRGGVQESPGKVLQGVVGEGSGRDVDCFALELGGRCRQSGTSDLFPTARRARMERENRCGLEPANEGQRAQVRVGLRAAILILEIFIDGCDAIGRSSKMAKKK